MTHLRSGNLVDHILSQLNDRARTSDIISVRHDAQSLSLAACSALRLSHAVDVRVIFASDARRGR
jgi:hypothetical protein